MKKMGVSTASTNFTTAGVEISTASPEVKTAGDSVDDIAIESLVQQEQERLGYEAALRLQKQLDEEERQRIGREHEAASSFNIEEWEDIQNRIEANEELAQSYTLQQLRGYSFDEIKSLFEATMKRVNTFTPMESDVDRIVPKIAAGSTKRDEEEELGQQSSKKQKSDKLSQEELHQLMIIVLEEGMNIEALQTKYLIIDWEVYTEDSRMSSYARAMIELRADVELKDNIVFGHVREECPKKSGAGVTKNLKKTSQTPKGIPVGQKMGFKLKQVFQPISKRATTNTCEKKMNNSESTKEVNKSNPFEVLTSVDNDVDLGTNGGISYSADMGTSNVSFSKTPNGIMDSDSKVKVVYDETANIRLSTSGKDRSDKGMQSSNWTSAQYYLVDCVAAAGLLVELLADLRSSPEDSFYGDSILGVYLCYVLDHLDMYHSNSEELICQGGGRTGRLTGRGCGRNEEPTSRGSGRTGSRYGQGGDQVNKVNGGVDKVPDFSMLARLVPHLVTSENKRIEMYIYGLDPQIHEMMATMEPTTIQSVILKAGVLTDEAIRNGSLRKNTEKRGNSREPSKDGNVKDDNKRSRTGRAFATTTNPFRKEYTRHFAKDCMARPRMVNPLNARNPTTTREACFECGGTHHYKAACPRLNGAPGQGRNHPNQVMAIKGGQGHGNNGNPARGRAFVMGAEEARLDLNIVTVPVMKSPYYLAPSKMEELSSQLKELQDN
ncbi:hypothetical protein Tco_1050560 [Tanacetum coccineum]